MTTKKSIPDIADVAPFPWEASLHNQLVDATGRGLLTIHDYWIGEENDDAIHDDDATRTIAWYVLDAVNSHAQLVAALYNLWLQVLIHHPRDTRLTIYADEAADALNHAGIDLLTGEALALAAGGEG